MLSGDNGSRKATDADDVLTADDIPFQLYFAMLNVPLALSHIMGSELTLVGSFVVSRNILKLQSSDST